MGRKMPGAPPPHSAESDDVGCEHNPLDAVLHVFSIVRGDMQTVWFPVPVAALFRRIVNVVSALSISNQYLHSTPDPDPPQPRPSALQWSNSPTADTRAHRGRPSTSYSYAYSEVAADLPEVTERPNPDTSSSSRTDQIHQLINNPVLYDPLRKPRYPIVLCHGESSQSQSRMS